MGLSDRRLTGRDVLAKTFHAKTKRGYDPVEVDAYLELVAAQIDVLHGDITRAAQDVPTGLSVPDPAPVAAAVSPEVEAELEQLRAQNAQLAAELSQEQTAAEALRAENEQLRVQLTAVAPPPPAAEAQSEVPTQPVVTASAAEQASEESYELVLRMAHRTAEETISQAHARADEIVAEAEFNAAQVSKESDRKAFEAANRVQAEIASLNTEIETQRGELAALQGHADHKRNELRGLAQAIIQLADQGQHRYEGAEVVDLRGESAVPSEPQI